MALLVNPCLRQTVVADESDRRSLVSTVQDQNDLCEAGGEGELIELMEGQYQHQQQAASGGDVIARLYVFHLCILLTIQTIAANLHYYCRLAYFTVHHHHHFK